MTSFKLRTPPALAVAAAIAALTAATALAGNTTRFDSKVTLSRNDPFHGEVKSQKHACVAHRTVKVFNAQAAPNGLFDKTKTDSDGDWSIDAMPNGDFYAKVKRHKKHADGNTFVCRSDLSPVRTFDK